MGLDGVEMVMQLEESLAIRIANEEAVHILTPRMASDLLATKVEAIRDGMGCCLLQRAFYRLRRGMTAVGVPRRSVRPNSRLLDLLPSQDRHTKWKNIRVAANIATLPNLTWGTGRWFLPRTIGEAVRWIVSHQAHSLLLSGERWTYSQVCTIVRAVTAEYVGTTEFSDDDEYVRDLGID